MRSTVLFAVVLVLNIGDGEGPRTLAGTNSIAAPQSTGSPSATQEVPPPDLQGFPTAPAPDALATVALPDTVNAVAALFERLPARVAGHTRSPQFDRLSPERPRVGYGEDRRIAGGRTSLLWLQAIDLTKGDFFPTNWTGGQVVAYMARQGKEAMEAGRDGDLFWMRNETSMSVYGSTERFLVYAMMWGRVDSPWMFSVQADTRESRGALLTAFVAAAKSAHQADQLLLDDAGARRDAARRNLPFIGTLGVLREAAGHRTRRSASRAGAAAGDQLFVDPALLEFLLDEEARRKKRS